MAAGLGGYRTPILELRGASVNRGRGRLPAARGVAQGDRQQRQKNQGGKT